MISNNDNAENLTVEAFGKAFKRLAQYSPNYALSTWLLKISSNNCIEFLRKKRLGKTVSFDSNYSNDDESNGSIDLELEGLNPEEKLMKSQRIGEMHRIVEQLKPNYR